VLLQTADLVPDQRVDVEQHFFCACCLPAEGLVIDGCFRVVHVAVDAGEAGDAHEVGFGSDGSGLSWGLLAKNFYVGGPEFAGDGGE
jgi:hypothetical protein